MAEFAIQAFNDILEVAMPISLVFNLGMLCVSTFLRVAFGGRLWFGK